MIWTLLNKMAEAIIGIQYTAFGQVAGLVFMVGTVFAIFIWPFIELALRL